MGLQTIMFLVVYLQCSSRMSACYTYVGLALKSALRMGMHRRVTASFTPLECQTRSRIFWVLRKVDIYVSTMLGLPDSIADDQIDQEMPLEVDDECILEDRVLPQPSGRLASIASTNAHIRLMGILKKITTYVYPLKGVEQNISGKTRVYFVDHSKIHEIENALKQWLDGLPSSLKEPASVSERLARCVTSFDVLLAQADPVPAAFFYERLTITSAWSFIDPSRIDYPIRNRKHPSKARHRLPLRQRVSVRPSILCILPRR